MADGALVRDWLPRRPADGHKGDFGKLLILAGSEGYTGAPALCARGSLRSGAGLVSLVVPREIYPIVAAKCDEAMVFPAPEHYTDLLSRIRGEDAALIGPGLGRHPRTQRTVRDLLADLEGPVVLDADGINALEGHIDSLEERRGRVTVLTPHDGEFARLGGDLSHGDRLGVARSFAVQRQCVLVLKGHRTITAWPDGQCFVNPTGNSGMAKGGSGDVLGGMVLALMGQGMDPGRAAVCAVWLHGRAGDLAAADKGEYGMLPGDLIEQIPYAIREVTPPFPM